MAGHRAARAGLQLAPERVDAFRSAFVAYAASVLTPPIYRAGAG